MSFVRRHARHGVPDLVTVLGLTLQDSVLASYDQNGITVLATNDDPWGWNRTSAGRRRRVGRTMPK